jgi:concanavalin A-like lectin/glucanase superfamily protein
MVRCLVGFLGIGAMAVVGCGTVSSQPDAGVGLCSADPTLVGCYRFEAASPPSLLKDESPAHNDGMIDGVSYPAGHEGAALKLSSASRVTIPESPSLDVTSLTLEMWVMPDTVAGAGALVGLFDNNQQYGLFLQSQNIVTCLIRTVLQNGPQLNTSVPIAIGRWTHLACTYDEVARVGRVFVDGAPVVVAPSPDPAINTTGTDGSALGADSPCPSKPCGSSFSGSIDSLRIWKRALPPAEICAHADRVSCP